MIALCTLAIVHLRLQLCTPRDFWDWEHIIHSLSLAALDIVPTTGNFNLPESMKDKSGSAEILDLAGAERGACVQVELGPTVKSQEPRGKGGRQVGKWSGGPK